MDPSKPVLLLDFDGVLNSTAWIGRAPKNPGSDYEYHRNFVNPALAAKVASLVQEYDCSVIVCSSWRITLSSEELRSLLGEHGIPFHGVTPYSSLNRTDEIREFVAQFPPRTNWLVIDDSVSENAFGGYRVVRPKDGLTDEDMVRARKLLSRRNLSRIST